MPSIPTIHNLQVDSLQPGHHRFWLTLVSDGLSRAVQIPLLVSKGVEAGPVLGITAVVHGNELNGLAAIRQLFQQLDLSQLRGTVVGVPVANAPGFLRGTRRFSDGVDLNRVMPGTEDGYESQVYAARLMNRVINQFDYLLDLHTASFGRINSFYVRADLQDPTTAVLANLQNADIILHKELDGTLRSAAAELGIYAITIEMGNPHRFQRSMVQAAVGGLRNVLIHLGQTPGEITPPDPAEPPVVCDRSYWLYTEQGGILEVYPSLTTRVTAGEPIARLSNVFGDVLQEYIAPEDGIVIGRSVNPVNQTGGRILHLGLISAE